jgi:hypothetical protein
LVTNLELVYASFWSSNSLKRKGKEIMEEQDAKSGSPKLLPPPELLDMKRRRPSGFRCVQLAIPFLAFSDLART